jgi:hypothetical protein
VLACRIESTFVRFSFERRGNKGRRRNRVGNEEAAETEKIDIYLINFFLQPLFVPTLGFFFAFDKNFFVSFNFLRKKGASELDRKYFEIF